MAQLSSYFHKSMQKVSGIDYPRRTQGLVFRHPVLGDKAYCIKVKVPNSPAEVIRGPVRDLPEQGAEDRSMTPTLALRHKLPSELSSIHIWPTPKTQSEVYYLVYDMLIA